MVDKDEWVKVKIYFDDKFDFNKNIQDIQYSITSKEIENGFLPEITESDIDTKMIEYSITSEIIDFKECGLSSLLLFAGGDLFAKKIYSKVRTYDISFSNSILTSFKGPQYGIQGIRDKLHIEDFPILSSMIYPKFGLSGDEYARIAKTLLENGSDMVVDDQYVVSNKICNVLDRAESVFSILNKLVDICGPKLYSINLTSGRKLVETYTKVNEIAEDFGVEEYIVIGYNAISGGVAGLEILCDISERPIQVHVGTHGLMTRGDFKMEMRVFCKLFRLLGGDLINAGHFAEKNSWYNNNPDVILNNYKSIRADWGNIKPSLPVAAGNIDPYSIEDNLNNQKKFGCDRFNDNDVVFLAGESVCAKRNYIKGIRCLKQAISWLHEGNQLYSVKDTLRTKEFTDLNEYLNNIDCNSKQ